MQERLDNRFWQHAIRQLGAERPRIIVDMNKCPTPCFETHGYNCPDIAKCIRKGVFKERPKHD